MAIHVVKVPDIGEGIAEVELVEWHVRPGDTVVADQALADVMTDKATVEVPSPVAGTVIAAAATLATSSRWAASCSSGDGGDGSRRDRSAASPRPSRLRLRTTLLRAGERRGHVSSAPNEKPLASPSVRRHARELGVELSQVRGTGPDGRIVHDDVVRHAAGRTAKPPVVQRYAERDGEHAVPVIGMRRQIALHMQASLRIPHFTYVEEVDATELEALRSKLNERFDATRGRLTVLPFLMRAIALAVPAFPQMNARFDDEHGHRDTFRRREHRHRDADRRRADGARRAPCRGARPVGERRRGRAARRRGAHGQGDARRAFGIDDHDHEPRPPRRHRHYAGDQRAGSGDRGRKPDRRAAGRAVANAIVPRRMMNLSSSFDHRVIDGRHAAEFVQALRGYLECPALLFVE